MRLEAMHEVRVRGYVVDMGTLHPCPHCGAWLFDAERGARGTTSPCCANGQIDLPLLPSPPRALLDLMVLHTPKARYFRRHIRSFNAALSFGSMGFSHGLCNLGPGPPTYVVHGHTYHRVGPVLPGAEGNMCIQLYFMQNADEERQNVLLHALRDPGGGNALAFEILAELEQVVREHNALFEHFRTAVEEFHARVAAGERPPEEFVLELSTNSRGTDRRRETDDVAVIWRRFTTSLPVRGYHRPVRLVYRIGNAERMFRTILHTSPMYDPSLYALLLPYGCELGWTYGMSRRQPEEVAEPDGMDDAPDGGDGVSGMDDAPDGGDAAVHIGDHVAAHGGDEDGIDDAADGGIDDAPAATAMDDDADDAPVDAARNVESPLSARDLYCFRLYHRNTPGDFPPKDAALLPMWEAEHPDWREDIHDVLHLGGRLYQMYCVDMYAKV